MGIINKEEFFNREFPEAYSRITHWQLGSPNQVMLEPFLDYDASLTQGNSLPNKPIPHEFSLETLNKIKELLYLDLMTDEIYINAIKK